MKKSALFFAVLAIFVSVTIAESSSVPNLIPTDTKVLVASNTTINPDWQQPVANASWSGDKKVYARKINSHGTEVVVSFQNAPPHKKGYLASTAFRTRVEMHPDGTIKSHVHPGVVFYGNLGSPIPDCTPTSSWCTELDRLLDQPIPSYPVNADKDWVHSWKGHRN